GAGDVGPLRPSSSPRACATTPCGRSRRRIANSSIAWTSNSGTSRRTRTRAASASATTCSGSPPHPIPARITSRLAVTSVTLQRTPPSSTLSDGAAGSWALAQAAEDDQDRPHRRDRFDREPHHRLDLAAELAAEGAERLGVLDEGFGTLEEQPPGIGERGAILSAIEQRHAELVLEVAHQL